MLPSRDRYTLGRMVADAVYDPELCPILADLIDRCNEDLAQSLRTHPTMHDLILASRLALPEGRAVYRRCRVVMANWVRATATDRQYAGDNGPEWSEVGLPGLTPTDREAEGSRSYFHWLMSQPETTRVRALNGTDHINRLVDRAVRGLDVPADVRTVLPDWGECLGMILQDLVSESTIRL